MATFAIQTPAITGTAPAARTASSGGDSLSGVIATADLWLRINNANGGASRTVTVDDPNTAGPEGATSFNPDLAVTVPASSTRVVHIQNPGRFINRSTGLVGLAYSSEADVTFEAYQ